MNDVAAIGTEALVGGFTLAGVRVYPADSAEQVRAAWQHMPATVRLVVLTGDAARELVDERQAPSAPLTVVVPA